MKITLTSSILWNGEHREVGDVLDIADGDAANLIGRGRAVPYTEPQEITTNRAIGVKKSQPENVTTRKSYKRKTTKSAS